MEKRGSIVPCHSKFQSIVTLVLLFTYSTYVHLSAFNFSNVVVSIMFQLYGARICIIAYYSTLLTLALYDSTSEPMTPFNFVPLFPCLASSISVRWSLTPCSQIISLLL